MDFESVYEISRTAEFIRTRGFSRVALQLPDELLKDSTRVARALRGELGRCVRLFVMADTAYGSCCVDEVGASHVDAECAVHYGQACMSRTTTLPAMFVLGKSRIDVNLCAETLHRCASKTNKPVLVLYGLEFTHALENIKAAVGELFQLGGSTPTVHYAEVMCSVMHPVGEYEAGKEQHGSHHEIITNGDLLKHGDNMLTSKSNCNNKMAAGIKYCLGGLAWNLPSCYRMENYLLFWIGSDNPAFSNAVLTFNNCEIVRFDVEETQLLEDFSHHKRILKRRYYLVEKAKDANIVGILVGTLSVAGYLHIVNQMKELIEGCGKKSYTFIMGRPNSAKLANFPECDIFVYVSCAQTALLDSKEFLAPVITPFEAVLAFSRGRQWTGEYVMNFEELAIPAISEVESAEARFSFIQGGYMEDVQPQENTEEGSLALAEITQKALNLKSRPTEFLVVKGTATSGSEFLAARSYQGLSIQYETPLPDSYLIGRTGKASGYENEKNISGNA